MSLFEFQTIDDEGRYFELCAHVVVILFVGWVKCIESGRADLEELECIGDD